MFSIIEPVKNNYMQFLKLGSLFNSYITNFEAGQPLNHCLGKKKVI